MKTLTAASITVALAAVAIAPQAAQDPYHSFYDAASSSAGQELGWRVAGGTDVNGDGTPDIVASAHGFDSDRGRVEVFSGRYPYPTLFVIIGQAQGDQFGKDVSTSGDFNGDGIADILITAYRCNTSAGGGAYLFLGHQNTATPDTIQAGNANLIISGTRSNSQFGGSAAIVCDVNGDGKADLLIGASGWVDTIGSTVHQGRAFVYHGRSLQNDTTIPDTSANLKLTEPNGAGVYGWAVAGVGDLDGNGKSEFIVTNYRYDPRNTSKDEIGRAYLYSDDGSLLETFEGENAYDYFGWSVAAAGDVNNDGTPDFTIGANTYWPGGFGSPGGGRGKIYVYSGLRQTSVPHYPLLFDTTGEDPSQYPDSSQNKLDFLGSAVSAAGDFDGDGSAEILVVGNSHPGYATPDTGTVYVYSPARRLELLRIFGNPTLQLGGGDPLFGVSIAGTMIDSSGHTRRAIIVGSSNDNEGQAQGGRVDLYVTGCCIDSTGNITICSPRPVSGGGCIARTGNVDCSSNNSCDISDLEAFIDHEFNGAPLCCDDEADVNEDGSVDVSDLSWLVDYFFNGGRPPMTCSGSNGPNY